MTINPFDEIQTDSCNATVAPTKPIYSIPGDHGVMDTKSSEALIIMVLQSQQEVTKQDTRQP
jgi:hypothetical protein